MKILKEVTDWGLDYNIGGHIYFTNDSKDKMFAYIKASGQNIERFRVPMPLKVSGRKFKEIENTFGYTVDDKPLGFVKIAFGSKGEKYTIAEVAGVYQCSCPGYKFRGKCRHIQS